MRRVLGLLLAALLPLVLGVAPVTLAVAADKAEVKTQDKTKDKTKDKTQDNAAKAPAMPATGLVLRGSLGADQVQLQLRPKPEDDGGVEGHYFIFGSGGQILLAGEFDDEGFLMEESVNGRDVSGQWEGRWQGDAFTGSWRGADDGPTRPFMLRIVRSAKPAVVR
ncbi:MAG: hypothetical protein Q7U14_13020 [Lacisediminimonas sp.]|nr:hypothetical protein [Lacisediminimonas sp.]